MARTGNEKLEPIRRSVSVSWSQQVAYDRFVNDFGKWWPSVALSIGGKRVRRVVLEPKIGGRIYEEHADGTRFLWGKVLALEPPTRLSFTFHSTRLEADAQTIEVSFLPEGTGTRVELVSSGWERMGPAARNAHGGYALSWRAALDGFAGKFSGTLLLFDVMSGLIDLTRGRDRFVRNSLSRMPAGGEEKAGSR